MARHFHHHYRSPLKRGLFSAGIILIVMVIGTAGMCHFEKMTYLDAFYFMSMIATAQGPTIIPVTTGGKLFASFMAFLSVGTVVAALGFLFGPFMGKLWKIGAEKIIEAEEKVEHKIKVRNGSEE